MISLIIPTLNEAENLPQLLRKRSTEAVSRAPGPGAIRREGGERARPASQPVRRSESSAPGLD